MKQNFHFILIVLKIILWFFALDHCHYAGWVPVHIRDMENLPTSIYNEFFENGHWVIQKTKNRFSAMPNDQAHEQNNALVKGSGGAIRLMQNPIAFRKWMLAGPEQARLIEEFENQFLENKDDDNFHHDEGYSTHNNFKLQVLSLVEAFEDMGNPFLDQSEDLSTLDTGIVMDESVVDSVRTIEALGKEQFSSYYKSVLIDCTSSIHDPIKEITSCFLKTQNRSQNQSNPRLLKT